MITSEHFIDQDDLHPIDIVQTIAQNRSWACSRISDDQLALSRDGQWRSYSITLAWCESDEILKFICSFEMAPPKDSLPRLYETLNRSNEMCWSGAFTFWEDQHLMVYRYGLALHGGQIPAADQIDQLIESAFETCERFYPAFQLVCWGDRSIDDALQIAMNKAYGRA